MRCAGRGPACACRCAWGCAQCYPLLVLLWCYYPLLVLLVVLDVVAVVGLEHDLAAGQSVHASTWHVPECLSHTAHLYAAPGGNDDQFKTVQLTRCSSPS